jgi:hypothetical protein
MMREYDSHMQSLMFERLSPLYTLRAFEASGRRPNMTLAAEE